MRKSIDGLAAIVQAEFHADLFEPSLFVFCNKANTKLKILHYDNGFWLYYRRLEKGKFRWPINQGNVVNIDFNELRWLINGHELRLVERKFETIGRVEFY